MNQAVIRGALWANDLRRLPGPERPCPGYVLLEVHDDELIPRLADAMGVDDTTVSGRLERGCRIFAACFGDDQVASWLWVSTGREWAPPLRRDLHFAPDECHGWGAGTLAEHRSRGLFSGLLRCAGWRMAQEGCRLMWNGILDENLPSQRAHARAGMRPILRLTAIHDPGPTRLRVRRADYADPELVRRARRLLSPAPKRCRS